MPSQTTSDTFFDGSLNEWKGVEAGMGRRQILHRIRRGCKASVTALKTEGQTVGTELVVDGGGTIPQRTRVADT